MLGFIKKDLLLVKNNYKTILISVIIFILFSFSNNTDISFFLPFMMLVIIISTFSYDDYNKWTIYSATFPNGRKNYIKGKYIATIILIIGITLINFILSFLLFSIKHSIDLEKFKTINKEDIITYKKNKYDVRILINNRKKLAKKYQDLLIDKITLEELMVLMIKGGK